MPEEKSYWASLVRLQVVKERSVSYPLGSALTDKSTLINAARAIIGDSDRENFVVMHLNTKHKINAVEVVSVGSLDACLVHPREVFKSAIVANARAIALAHNHPSGDPTPSPEDLSLTTKLLQAGEILGIRVLDHVILGDFVADYSMREQTDLWFTEANRFHL